MAKRQNRAITPNTEPKGRKPVLSRFQEELQRGALVNRILRERAENRPLFTIVISSHRSGKEILTMHPIF